MGLVKLSKRQKKDNTTEAYTAVGELSAAGLGGKHLYDRGYLDGRTTLYHGTAEKNLQRFEEQGFDSKYRGKNNIYDKLSAMPNEVKDASRGKLFLDHRRPVAQMYAMQYDRNGNRVGPEHFEFRNRNNVVKMRIPLHSHKTISNPESFGSAEEFLKKQYEAHGLDFSRHKGALNERELIGIRKMLDEATAIDQDVSSKFVKGRNYRAANLAELAEYIKARPGKATLGALGLAGAAGLSYDALRRLNGVARSSGE
jgi:hypothetical protein